MNINSIIRTCFSMLVFGKVRKKRSIIFWIICYSLLSLRFRFIVRLFIKNKNCWIYFFNLFQAQWFTNNCIHQNYPNKHARELAWINNYLLTPCIAKMQEYMRQSIVFPHSICMWQYTRLLFWSIFMILSFLIFHLKWSRT